MRDLIFSFLLFLHKICSIVVLDFDVVCNNFEQFQEFCNVFRCSYLKGIILLYKLPASKSLVDLVTAAEMAMTTLGITMPCFIFMSSSCNHILCFCVFNYLVAFLWLCFGSWICMFIFWTHLSVCVFGLHIFYLLWCWSHAFWLLVRLCHLFTSLWSPLQLNDNQLVMMKLQQIITGNFKPCFSL